MRHNGLLHYTMLNITNTQPILVNSPVKLAGKTVKCVTKKRPLSEPGGRYSADNVF